MFIAFLRFAAKEKAPHYMEGHNQWIQQGLKDHHILAVGSLQPKTGGVVFLNFKSQGECKSFLDSDPFVKFGVVETEIQQIHLHKTIPQLEALTT